MIESYAVGVSAKLQDDVTPSLLRIIETLGKANAAMLEFAENARIASRAGTALSRAMVKSAEASTAMGDSAGALARASYVLDTMAASSADLARNMEAARAAGVGMGRGPGGVGPGSPPGAGRGSRESGGRFATAAGVTGASLLFGAYENARLNDTNVRAMATAQVPSAQWGAAAADLRRREMAYASKYAWATGGHIAPFGDAMLESSRLLRTLSPAQQKQMLDTAMPYAAVESKLKGVSLPEATQAFIGLAHQAGAYTPKEAGPLFEAMMQASLTTHASLGQISRAASYALPSLHAAGANASDVMLLVATMMQGGIMNTKSGTWLNALAANSLPNTLGSGLFSNKKQNEALHTLGLYKGNKSQFYKNGSMDLMQLVSILAGDREHMEPLQFNALLKMAFGTQGQRAASFFSEATTLGNIHSLSALKNNAMPPANIGQMIGQLSTVAKADQTIANANITLMNGTATFMGPVNAALNATSSFFSKTADISEKHPVLGGAMDAGMLFTGAMAGMSIWKGAKGASAMLERAVVGISKATARGIGSVIERAMVAITGEEVGVAALAALGGTVAVGAAVIGALGYVLKRAFDTGLRNFNPSPSQHPFWVGPMGEVMTDDTMPKATAGHAAPNYHFTVTLDGHEIAAKVTHRIAPAKSTGSTGFNPAAALYGPGMAIGNQ